MRINLIDVGLKGKTMNALKQLQKYERLAEIAHKLGGYKCARKWSIKAEKIEAVINALENVGKEIKQVEDSIIITVPSSDFWVWLWSDGMYGFGTPEDYERAQDEDYEMDDDDRKIIRSYSQNSLDYPTPGTYKFYVKNLRKNGESPVLEEITQQVVNA